MAAERIGQMDDANTSTTAIDTDRIAEMDREKMTDRRGSVKPLLCIFNVSQGEFDLRETSAGELT